VTCRMGSVNVAPQSHLVRTLVAQNEHHEVGEGSGVLPDVAALAAHESALASPRPARSNRAKTHTCCIFSV
jgi:hypothetical protein